MYLLYQIPNPANGKQHFGGSALALDKLSFFGWAPWDGSRVQIYVGFVALILNLLVAVLGTLVLRAAGAPTATTTHGPRTTTPPGSPRPRRRSPCERLSGPYSRA